MHLVEHKVGRFGFTATSLAELEASEYTLIQILIDGSSSMCDRLHRIEAMLSGIVAACQQSPHKYNLMLRVVTFGPAPREIHGFKMISQCNSAEYSGVLASDGPTALIDAMLNGVEASGAYAEYLDKQDYLVNGLLIVITDGLDNSSITLPNELMNALARASKAESLNSFTSLLVGIVGMSDRKSPAYKEVSGALRRFQREVGFSSFIEVDSLDEDAASSLADFLYNSIHIVNDSLGTGCVSPLLAH